MFGRRIATLPGYNFSPALKKLDIVWTPETVAKLFEVGPMAYTPGTKMPEQTIGSAEDRDALVKFLEKATRNNSAQSSRSRFLPVIIARTRFSFCSAHISSTPSTCTTARISTRLDE